MLYFCDVLAFFCIFSVGISSGFYAKHTYFYNNLWTHWPAMAGAAAILFLCIFWTIKKQQERQYNFIHFYVLFYVSLCILLSGIFQLLTELDFAFCFSFVACTVALVAVYSYTSLRSNSRGVRPCRIACANALYFYGLTAGFALFNEFPQGNLLHGWLLISLAILLILGITINQMLQYFQCQNYKISCDVAFNLLNAEKLIFLRASELRAQFKARPDYNLQRNYQWLLLALSFILLLERVSIYSTGFLLLTWRASYAYSKTTQAYAPFLLYALGGSFSAIILLHFKAKSLYLICGVFKITLLIALMGIFKEEALQNSLALLYIYYVVLGANSSIFWQLLLECAPFLYTELALALGLCLELLCFELYKLELLAINTWTMLLVNALSQIMLSILACIIVQLMLPPSKGLVEMRNYLMGIRRHGESKQRMFHANFYMHHIKKHTMT